MTATYVMTLKWSPFTIPAGESDGDFYFGNGRHRWRLVAPIYQGGSSFADFSVKLSREHNRN
ncbi:hypothetical protein H0178_48485 [Cytobacillus firmus]|nr:hypothetical protein [Cytobacillus firmus]